MKNIQVKIKKVRENAKIPEYATSFAAGADLFACIENTVDIIPGQTELISAGIALEIPEGFAGFVFARSGLACKNGLAPANKVGVIDSDYRGEVFVALHNHSGEVRSVSAGERIAQIVIMPYYKADFILSRVLEDTKRGDGAFGSTGE